MKIRFCALLISKFMMTAAQHCTISSGLQRLGSVEGFKDKANDIIYHPAADKLSNIVIYFGGDIQDYTENMLSHRDNKNYEKWNLESTASLLHNKFPNADIFIVRPYRMHLKTFSCYSNFMKSNDFGVPSHETSVDALRHLSLLVQNAQEKVCRNKEDPQQPLTNGSMDIHLPIILIGFSKGCVVLNQLLFSFMALTKESSSESHSQIKSFVKRIKVMYWLDGGHNGSNNTWITDKSILENYCELNVKTRIHVTPYQMMCPTRPRLGKEEKQFRETLRKSNNDVERTLYFEDLPQSAEMHFQVLVEFQPNN